MAKDYEGEFLKAKNYYKNLPDEFWEKFVNAVRWQFEVIPQDEAIPRLMGEIQELIRKLPLPIDTSNPSKYLAVLHWEIARRTIDTAPERRILSNGLLDFVVLNQIDEENKWYAEVYDKWNAHPEVNHFSIGQFLEIIDATRHCRWELAGAGHADLWLCLLKAFQTREDTPAVFRRKAVYEYIFLKKHASFFDQGKSLTNEDADLVREYFEHFEDRYELADIEEDIILIEIITRQSKDTPGFIKPEEIKKWSDLISKTIEEGLSNPRDINEQCLLLELKGSALMHFDDGPLDIEKIRAGIDVYRQIIPLVSEANSYTITRLSDVLKRFADLYISIGEDYHEAVEEIKRFRKEISKLAPEAKLRHDEAHDLVMCGAAYLEKGGATNLLRALDSFHQAGKLWLMDETMVGYILALLNMSQVYNALGANYAGKYYALCAVWSSLHTGDEKALAKMSDGYALVFNSDYKQGAWFSALDIYIPFMNHRNDLKPGNPAEDQMVIKIFINLLLIVESTYKVYPEAIHFVNYFKHRLGDFYSKAMWHLVEPLQKHVAETGDILEFISRKVDDTPFNDSGPSRVIRFKMLGPEWRIHFDNSYKLTGMAEEFAAALQIILCEIGLSGKNLQLCEGVINIYITEALGEHEVIEQQGHSNSWSLRIPHRDEHNPQRARFHYSFLGTNIKYVLIANSALDKTEMDSFFEYLYVNQQMGEKSLTSTTYQRAYFKAIHQEHFESSGRAHFPPSRGRFDFPLYDNLTKAIKKA